MNRLIRPTLLLFFLGLAPALFAQIETFPYAGYGWSGTAHNERRACYDLYSEQGSWLLGADVLIGSGRLAPLAGLAVALERQRRSPDRNFLEPLCFPLGPKIGRGDQLMPSLGLTYRLRPASTSFNLLLTGAVSAEVPLQPDRGPIIGRQETGMLSRLGIRLTLDYLVLGLEHHWQFREDEGYEGQFNNRLALTIGGRF